MEYTTVTEGPGTRITREGASMIFTRYAFAADFCEDCDVLEVACGPGIGLGYLAQRARRVVGADCTESFLQSARQHYSGKINLVRLDAHSLPLPDASFDTIVFFEAIYYLAEPRTFLEECRRVLRPHGTLLICTVNPHWPGFHPSPFSARYFGAHDFRQLLQTARFDTKLFAAFPVLAPTLDRIAQLRRLAVRLNLIPRTMKGKELFKRLIYGRLVRLSAEIKEDFAERVPVVPLAGEAEADRYKILYAVARKNGVHQAGHRIQAHESAENHS